MFVPSIPVAIIDAEHIKEDIQVDSFSSLEHSIVEVVGKGGNREEDMVMDLDMTVFI